MDVVDLIFGRRPPQSGRTDALPVLTTAPADVTWHTVRPRSHGAPVRAHVAEHDGVLKTKRGQLAYRAGAHYLVSYSNGDRSVVRRDIFERTYTLLSDGRYEKRRDLTFPYFTLPYAAIVATLEGQERARKGDWIMKDADGGLYPLSPAYGRQTYAPVETAAASTAHRPT